MKKDLRSSTMIAFFIFALIIGLKILAILPWWAFIVPVMALGAVIAVKGWNVPTFTTGFVAGFILWFAANLYFDLSLHGLTLTKISLLMTVPKIVVLLISGLIGGLLTGLALYTGKLIVPQKERPFVL